jgi:recombination protein RecR
MHYPEHLLKLIQLLKKFPGVGHKSAERFAFHLLTWHADHLEDFAETVKSTPLKLIPCATCGCLLNHHYCQFCDLSIRNAEVLCILASPKDVFSIEETREYKGLYHVLGGLLSPLDQRGPERLSIPQLKERLAKTQVKEIVIALDSTLEGDATALYLKQELAAFPLTISRLAFGLPMGSSIDYVDGGTLARAFTGRSRY